MDTGAQGCTRTQSMASLVSKRSDSACGGRRGSEMDWANLLPIAPLLLLGVAISIALWWHKRRR